MGARTRTAAALLPALALVLAACGGGGDGDDATDATDQGLEDLLDDLGADDGFGDVDLGPLDPDGTDLDSLDELGDLGDLDLDQLEGLDLGALDLGALLGDGLEGLQELFGDERLAELIEEGAGGAVDVEVGEDGLTIESEDGTFSLDEDGEFTVTDADGEETTGRVDLDGDNGGLSVERDDGEMRVDTAGELPEEWPDDVPRPEGLEVESAVAVDDDGTTSVVVTGTIDSSATAWMDDYVSALEAAGFEDAGTFEAGDDLTSSLQREDWNVVVVTTAIGGRTRVSVTVTSLG